VSGARGGDCSPEGKKASMSAKGKKTSRKKSPGGDAKEPVIARKDKTDHALPYRATDRSHDRGPFRHSLPCSLLLD
jgi:hypothetical protein